MVEEESAFAGGGVVGKTEQREGFLRDSKKGGQKTRVAARLFAEQRGLLVFEKGLEFLWF